MFKARTAEKKKWNTKECLNIGKIELAESGKSVKIFLWKDHRAMWNQIDPEYQRCMAAFFPVAYMENEETKEKKSPKRIGELHFFVDGYDLEIVSHECLHATFHFERSNDLSDCWVDGYEPITAEEKLCLVHGEMIKKVYTWLHNSQPSKVPPFGRDRFGYKWEYERCKHPDCAGKRNNIGFDVPDKIWKKVVPEGMNVVCLSCFDKMAQEKGVKYAQDLVTYPPITWSD